MEEAKLRSGDSGPCGDLSLFEGMLELKYVEIPPPVRHEGVEPRL